MPTMGTMARRQEHYRVEMDPACLVCQASEEEGHMWECPATIKEANKEVQRLKEWLERNVYAGEDQERNVPKALADPLNLLHMAAALPTKTMKKYKLLRTSKALLGTLFICQVVLASQRLWAKHYKARAAAIRARKGEGWDTTDLMEEVKYQSIREYRNKMPRSDRETSGRGCTGCERMLHRMRPKRCDETPSAILPTPKKKQNKRGEL